jgi:dipeptidyl aminopeptidase/acylaminoacyl peptidase
MGANVTPWNSTKLYEDQSPIFHVNNIKTPFMILQGMEDGAVDYVEGLQFFNAARAAGKQVICCRIRVRRTISRIATIRRTSRFA